ncbi:flagellar motor protein MotB [Clostridium sp. BSD9I1]|uniref:flagellar motor protein MotB n=1 Tax=Clostridium sp. BSD9I1 TaxID=2003589 RepID=UPI0016477D7A|nr:flagellar motor protein MotB [Clostridium sp. BSD9I1]
MRKKKEHHEEHVDESWLIPYGDMLTLLLALFIVMFAMSELDKAKFKSVSEDFNVIFSGGSGVMTENGSTGFVADESKPASTADNVVEDKKMKEVMGTLQQEIKKRGYSDNVKLNLNDEGLGISIQDVVLFNSGDARVLKEVEPLLLQISSMIHKLDNNVKVVGHTDNIPISNEKFHSNWELSAMRAINVMNFMADAGGIDSGKLSIEAYAEYMPKYDNSTEEGRARNRRVEIFVVRKYSAPAKDDKAK